MSTKPVVVYGASGYTGRLVCEYLREHNIGFVAAGRNKDRLATSMERHVPGIETADYEIAEVEHSTDSLTKLLTGAKVHYLEENQYVEGPADGGLFQVVVPGQHELGLALPWGGTSHPVWFKQDPRVQNVRVLGGILNPPLMNAVPQIVQAILAGVEG